MAQPFIKFPGGKRDHAVLDVIARLWPSFCDTYIEPFLGGGAVFFGLQARGLLDNVHVILSDADADLIDLYEAVRTQPQKLANQAEAEAEYVAGYTNKRTQQKAYNDARHLWNLGREVGEADPGLQLYLRHACYNGVFRRNLKGEMNMSARDKLAEIRTPTMATLMDAAKAFEDVNATLLDWHFNQFAEAEQAGQFFAGPGTLVYLDPPYDGPSTAFREYIGPGFSDDEQQQLIELAAYWAAQGATVVYSNANTPLIRQALKTHWPDAAVEYITAKRTVSCDGTARHRAPELIAHTPAITSTKQATATAIDPHIETEHEVRCSR